MYMLASFSISIMLQSVFNTKIYLNLYQEIMLEFGLITT